VRNAVLQVVQADPTKYTAIPFPGSGTAAIEATVTTLFGGDQAKVTSRATPDIPLTPAESRDAYASTT